MLLYDSARGALTKLTLITEHGTNVDPAQPDVLQAQEATGRLRSERPRLAGPPSAWLPRGARGVRVSRLRPQGGGLAEAAAAPGLTLEEGRLGEVAWHAAGGSTESSG